VAIDRRHLGVISEPRVVTVEAGQLRFFARATGETNPVYVDDAAARAAGHRALPAPPTFLFSLQMGAPAKRGDMFDPVGGVGVDMRRVLHGEQAFTNHRQIYAGDVLTLTTETIDITTKKGGLLELVVQETKAVDAEGRLCADMRVTTVLRNG
jgi:acyl dehydratase